MFELKRPRKTRWEIEFQGQTAVQVYDGTNGWKLRPYLGRKEVESYKPEELAKAAAEAELDRPLLDYAAKGATIELEGVEKVEGKDNYKLKLTPKGQPPLHVWVDEQTFLESKIEGPARRLDGRPRGTAVYLRDYRKVDGLAVAYARETVVEGVRQGEKMQIEAVSVNPKLDDSRFTKPVVK